MTFPLSEGYGLTETTGPPHTIRWSSLGNRPGSVGQPVGHTRSKIVDWDGNEVGPGEEGEILIQGPQVMKRYYDNPEIHEAAVFGVTDERRGETVVAAITPAEGAEITDERGLES